MEAERTCGAGFALKFGEEAQSLLRCRRNGPKLQKRIQEFRMFLGPASCVYISPELRSFRTDEADSDVASSFGRWFPHSPIEDVTYFDRPVVPGTKHVERSNSCKRAHFVEHRRAAIEEEALDRIQ